MVAEKFCRAIYENINLVLNVVSSSFFVMSSYYDSVVSEEWRVAMPRFQK